MTSTSRYGYSRIRRLVEVTGIGAVAVLSLAVGWRIWINARGRAAWLVIAVSVVLAYVLADFVSGVFHWFADRFGTTRTPLLGKMFIRPFREHHADPEAITRHDFIETNGNNCLVSAPLLAATWFLLPAAPGPLLRLFVMSTALFLSVSVLATNQFHKWAHMAEPPTLARILQSARLILTRAHHEIHHVAPFNTHYCITTGWFNSPLAKLKFFETLECILRPLQAGLNREEVRSVTQ